MKIPYKAIESFVKKPDPFARAVLFYGPESGLMRERAKTMGLSVVDDINDPFNVAVLSSDILTDDPARLADEAGAVSMMGGERLIRVENASDKITALIKNYLDAPQETALVILEAGELGPRSSLRLLCERAANAAAIPCYIEDERDLSRFIKHELEEENLHIERDALEWLSTSLTGNRMRARREIEKLIVYKGNGSGALTLEDAQNCCGEAGAKSLDDLAYNIGSQNSEKAMAALDQLLQEGVSFMAILRSLQNHFRRLHLASTLICEGQNAESAMKSLHPPVFFKQQAAFRQQCERWSLTSLEKVMTRLFELEADCKKTGRPQETLCAQILLGLCMMKR